MYPAIADMGMEYYAGNSISRWTMSIIPSLFVETPTADLTLIGDKSENIRDH